MRILNKQEALQFVAEHRVLFDAAGERNPFAGSAWMLHFIDQVAAPDWRFFVPADRSGGEAIMLLYADPKQPRQLKAPTNSYTSLHSPIIASGPGSPTAHAWLVDQLANLRPRPDTVNLGPLDRGAVEVAALKRHFASRGWYARQYFCFGNWHLPCAGQSFSRYMAERPTQLQHTWMRKRKLFARPGARLEIVTRPDELDAALAAYAQVYAKSWKEPERHPLFVPGWARICADNGWLRLGLAWVDDQPIAAQFWFVMHERAYIFKLAYDEAYAKWSAGTVLTAHLIEHCLERDQVVEIDFLSGDDAYKSAWMKDRRERIGIIASNLRTRSGLLSAALHWARATRERWQTPAPAGGRRAAAV